MGSKLCCGLQNPLAAPQVVTGITIEVSTQPSHTAVEVGGQPYQHPGASIPEQSETQACCQQQEEASMVQAQSRACIDFGEPYTHSIYCYCLASKHVHNRAVQAHSHCLGASEATGPTGQVLDGDTEAATSLSHEQVLAGPRKGKDQPIECHIVGSTRCLAPSTASLTCTVPPLSLAHTNVAVFLDSSIGWVPLSTVAARTKIWRHTVLVQQHGTSGIDTAISTSSQTGMVGSGAVTGEKAGTRGIDELLGAEWLLWRAVVGYAVPEALLLADAVAAVFLGGSVAKGVTTASKLTGAHAGRHTLTLKVPQHSWGTITTSHTDAKLFTLFWLPTMMTAHWGTLLVFLAIRTQDRAQCLISPMQQETLLGTAACIGREHRAQTVPARGTATHSLQAPQSKRFSVY